MNYLFIIMVTFSNINYNYNSLFTAMKLYIIRLK